MNIRKPFFFACMFLAMPLFSQAYYFQKFKGGNPVSGNTGEKLNLESDAIDDLAHGWQLVLDPVIGPSYSKAQAMPVNFSFKGNVVKGFKASSTGFITFDTSVSGTPPNANILVPNIALPSPCISFGGVKGYGENDRIVCKVFGAAPYRQLWIKFSSYSSAQDTAEATFSYFSIVLEETTNQIYLVFQYQGRADGPVIAPYMNPAVQAGNSEAVAINNGTDNTYVFPATSKENDNYYYTFFYGNQASHDLAVGADENIFHVKTGVNVSPSYFITENGGQKTDSTELFIQVDGNPVQQKKIAFSWLSSSQNSYSGTLDPVNFTDVSGNIHTVKIWIEKANNTYESITQNDTQVFRILVVNGSSEIRRSLVESATGSWCGVCPGNNLTLDRLKEKYADTMILVQHHFLDEMQGKNDAYFDAHFEKVPDVMLNKKRISDFSKTGKMLDTQVHSTDWVPASVEVQNVNLDQNTGAFTYSVFVKFSDYYLGKLRIGGYVLEDNVRGSGAGFSQTIYDTLVDDISDWYYKFSSPITGYYHVNVAWNINGGNDGIEKAEAFYEPGDTFSISFKYIFPELLKPGVIISSPYLPVGDIISYGKPADMKAVGYLSGIRNGNPEFMNAAQTIMWNQDLAQKNIVSGKITMYPNPAQNLVNIHNNNGISNVTLLDISGRKVFESAIQNHTQDIQLHFDEMTANAGIYTVTVVDGRGNVSTGKLMIAR